MSERLEELMYASGLTASGCWDQMDDYDRKAIERLAKLVAAHEREACANICKEMYLSGDMDTGLAEEAIRARDKHER